MNIDSVHQILIDKTGPKIWLRWTFFGVLLLLFFMKIFVTGSHHLIAYCLGVYLVHGFVLFATPKDERIPDPFEEDDINDIENDYTPVSVDNNLRPFIRNMPEFTYWLFCIKIVIGSLLLSMFSFTDIPVYTPILVLYFVFMISATVIKLWRHSSKYNYSLFFTSKSVLKE